MIDGNPFVFGVGLGDGTRAEYYRRNARLLDAGRVRAVGDAHRRVRAADVRDLSQQPLGQFAVFFIGECQGDDPGGQQFRLEIEPLVQKRPHVVDDLQAVFAGNAAAVDFDAAFVRYRVDAAAAGDICRRGRDAELQRLG